MHGLNHRQSHKKVPWTSQTALWPPFCLHPVWPEYRIPGAKHVTAKSVWRNKFPGGRHNLKYCHWNQWILLELKTALAAEPKVVITGCQKHPVLMKEEVRQNGNHHKTYNLRMLLYLIWLSSPFQKIKIKNTDCKGGISPPFHKAKWLGKNYYSWVLKKKVLLLFFHRNVSSRTSKNNWTKCKVSEQNLFYYSLWFSWITCRWEENSSLSIRTRALV